MLLALSTDLLNSLGGIQSSLDVSVLNSLKQVSSNIRHRECPLQQQHQQS